MDLDLSPQLANPPLRRGEFFPLDRLETREESAGEAFLAPAGVRLPADAEIASEVDDLATRLGKIQRAAELGRVTSR